MSSVNFANAGENSRRLGPATVAELVEQVLDFSSPKVRFRVIQRHRAMQAALRCLEPLARFLQVAKEIHRVAEEARE